MADYFPIIEIALDAPSEDEQIGTKEKFWFDHESLGRCLYKKARPNTGEDWSEKIAAHLSELLQLPHAKYELARFQGKKGILSPYFLPEGGSLTFGNEILSRIVPGYLRDIKSPPQHTINSVLDAIASNSINLPVGWNPPEGITKAVEIFVGYILLDAWIGNTDRHHENWAFVNLVNKTYLAPTYDHASCLGRELLDKKRKERLKTNDSGFSVKAYINKSPSAFYAQVGDKTTLKTFDVFYQAAQRYPNAALFWLDCLANISSTSTLELFERIPQERISASAIKFAQKVLELNQSRLLQLRKSL
ncbi:MAG: HipA-like protein [Cyanobacteria bacterium P01_A01_bin.84]